MSDFHFHFISMLLCSCSCFESFLEPISLSFSPGLIITMKVILIHRLILRLLDSHVQGMQNLVLLYSD